ncbi:hypothetical protein B0A49_09991 [Cryomyces minteri]|uniref:Carboxylic ester hydrolase n=1 Tax=Cryomyces minteri TaxID=331657 RepID=A0A4U0WP17_9PEZI|nr:hypothetical protein B0A49_09991 [Cryomyces minteri]
MESEFPNTGLVGSPSFIAPSIWTGLIHDEVLKQYDGIDGVKDGIIEDPDLCIFRPEALICGKGNTTNCLSSNQIDQVRRIYSPLRDNGRAQILLLSTILVLYRLVQDAAAAQKLNPFDIETWPSDFSTYEKTGDKILSYHGGQDHDMDNFFRFFRISGMFHCNGGPGAWVIGQAGAGSVSGKFQAQYNVLAALVDLVENGKAPDTIEGTKFVNDTVSLGIEFTRKHCKHPIDQMTGADDKMDMDYIFGLLCYPNL